MWRFGYWVLGIECWGAKRGLLFIANKNVVVRIRGVNCELDKNAFGKRGQNINLSNL